MPGPDRRRPLDRVAVVSDVHGNLTAYEAVLADITARGITRVVNLGDLVGKGPRSSEVIRATRASCEATVRGNWDTHLADLAGFVSRGELRPSPLRQWTFERLSDEDRRWLAALPATVELVLSGRRIRLLHASATSEFDRVLRSHTRAEFESMFVNTDFTGPFRAAASGHRWPDGTRPDVVGYGDIHTAYLIGSRGLTLFNPGSVGNHLDHPTASYAILEGVADSPEPGPFGISLARVPYDIDAEVDAARALGLPDVEAYRREIAEGVYRGSGRTT